MSKWLETVKKGCALAGQVQYHPELLYPGDERGALHRPEMDAALRQGRPGDGQENRSLCAEQLDMVLDMGFIPYKTPVWAIRKLEERADRRNG